MGRLNNILKVLLSLSEGKYSVLTISKLARLSGYKSAAAVEFKEALLELQRKGVLQIQQSGFSHSTTSGQKAHPKIVVLRANLMYVYPSEVSTEKGTNMTKKERFTFKYPKEKYPRTTHVGINRQLKTSIRDFFVLILERNFKKSRVILNEIKSTLPKSEYFSGIYIALFGMLTTSGEADDRPFMKTLNLHNNKQLQQFKVSFRQNSKNQLRPLYDRGFFFVWYLYMDFLIRRNKI